MLWGNPYIEYYPWAHWPHEISDRNTKAAYLDTFTFKPKMSLFVCLVSYR